MGRLQGADGAGRCECRLGPLRGAPSRGLVHAVVAEPSSGRPHPRGTQRPRHAPSAPHVRLVPCRPQLPPASLPAPPGHGTHPLPLALPLIPPLAPLSVAQAGAVTGAAVIVFLSAGTNVLAYLPRAVLGGLVVGAVIPLLKPVKSTVSWMTFVVTMCVSPRLELGLLAGLVLSSLLSGFNALASAGLSEDYPAVPVSRRRQMRRPKPLF